MQNVAEVLDLIKGTEAEEALIQLSEASSEFDQAKKALASAKKRLSRVLSE